jgi:hypothetical protein
MRALDGNLTTLFYRLQRPLNSRSISLERPYGKAQQVRCGLGTY